MFFTFQLGIELNLQLIPTPKLLFQVQIAATAPYLALAHDCDPVTQIVSFIHLVCGQDNHPFLFQFFEDVP